jgi:transposase
VQNSIFGDESGMSLKISEEVIGRQPAEAQAIIRLLLAEIENLRGEIERVKKTSRNSSLPPSSEHPHAKPLPQRPKSKNKRGGQPGHGRHERALVPTEDCDQVIGCKPDHCRRCGRALRGRDPAPLRHQVWELPEIKPLVTEYQRHRLLCGCGTTTCGELPPGVSTGQAGPRLVALTALLMGCFRQSKRRVALFLEQILNQPCSHGWVVKLQNQATAALRPAYEELAARLPAEKVLWLDETPTKEGLKKSWLWTYVAPAFTVFAVRPSREASGVSDMLGPSFGGVVHCDRARMYMSLERLQWCWSHLKRDFQALIDEGQGKVKRLGQDLMRTVPKLFRLWARCRDGTVQRAVLQRRMRPVRQEIEELLLRGAYSGERRLQGMCRELYEHRQWLWTFLDVEGVEPTNNASERALRHAVIWRKLSFGTQSAAGSRYVETLLTIVETCRQQHRPVFNYLAESIQAHWSAKPSPSLVFGA